MPTVLGIIKQWSRKTCLISWFESLRHILSYFKSYRTRVSETRLVNLLITGCEMRNSTARDWLLLKKKGVFHIPLMNLIASTTVRNNRKITRNCCEAIKIQQVNRHACHTFTCARNLFRKTTRYSKQKTKRYTCD